MLAPRTITPKRKNASRACLLWPNITPRTTIHAQT